MTKKMYEGIVAIRKKLQAIKSCLEFDSSPSGTIDKAFEKAGMRCICSHGDDKGNVYYECVQLKQLDTRMF